MSVILYELNKAERMVASGKLSYPATERLLRSKSIRNPQDYFTHVIQSKMIQQLNTPVGMLSKHKAAKLQLIANYMHRI